MRLAVVGSPVLDRESSRAIESFRARHDPLAGRIPAHFTLVFPLDADAQALATEIRGITSSTPPVEFRLVRVSASLGIDGRSYVLLEPDVGRDRMEELHDRLYSGMLQPDLRADVGFVPHVTVGAGEAAVECEAAAGALRQSWRPICGRIDELVLLDLDRESPRAFAMFSLGG